MSKTDASKKSGKKKKLRKLAAKKLAHAAANNAQVPNEGNHRPPGGRRVTRRYAPPSLAFSRMHRRWATPITGAR